MKFSDKVCDLKCVENTGKVHDFNGPVKIILVDPPEDQYGRRKAAATFVTLANMMIGANLAIVLLFTLGFKLPIYNNAHVILCTLGYQFCMPSAILMVHALNGASAPMKKTQRRQEHMMVHVIGNLCAAFGIFLVYEFGEDPIIPYNTEKDTSFTAHFGTGMATAISSVVCVVTGPLMMCMKTELETPGLLTHIHRAFGMLSFLLASVCFILGIIKPSFHVWLYILGYKFYMYVMLFCTLFYTSVVLVNPAIKFKKIPLLKIGNTTQESNNTEA